MTTHSGVRYAVYLELSRYRTDRGTPLTSFGQADIDGHISWCAHRIPNTRTNIFGHANRSASSVVLESSEVSKPPPGLFPIHLHGAWHGSTLVLNVLFYLVRNRGYVYSSAIPDDVRPVRLTLHKRGSSAFAAACAHV